MVESVQETRLPEPPAKPQEVPKPTAQSERAEARDPGRPTESQLSAQQDARDAARSEHAAATDGREPDGPRSTPEEPAQRPRDADVGQRPDEPQDGQRPDEPQGGRGPDELQNGRGPDESQGGQRPDEPQGGQRPDEPQGVRESQEATPVERDEATPAGEQAGEHAAVREAAAAERAEAVGDTDGPDAAAGPRSDPESDRPEPDRPDPTPDRSEPDRPDPEPDPAPDRPDPAPDRPESDEGRARPPVEAGDEAGNDPTAPPDDSAGDAKRRRDTAPQHDPTPDLPSDTSEPGTEGVGTPPGDGSTAVETAAEARDLTRVGDSSGPWYDAGTNHREGGAVQQETGASCVSAAGEMLTEGRITQSELLAELGDGSNLTALRNELNNRDGDGTWTGHYFADGGDALRRASEGPMAAQVQAPGGAAHMVLLEPGENGSFTVRDPFDGSSYDVDGAWVEKYVAGGVFR
ncbi:hypothetical protein AB0B27_05945 [Micromonospora rifamycinica]|uniref:hypothetical protein n=1 Tax=Micromonospora rifamycinica TaxID=291594 RepID=UPI0033DD503F